MFRLCKSAASHRIRPQINATRITSCSKMTATSSSTQYILAFYVPKNDTDKVTAAVHKTGAGTYPGGIYGECAFITSGTGTFRPLAGANPAIGKVGDVERVEENKVEVVCIGKDCMVEAVEALKAAHPYEQVAYYVTRTEDI